MGAIVGDGYGYIYLTTQFKEVGSNICLFILPCLTLHKKNTTGDGPAKRVKPQTLVKVIPFKND
jgi:hypothetical protein